MISLLITKMIKFKKLNMFQKVKIMPQYSNLYQKLFKAISFRKRLLVKYPNLPYTTERLLADIVVKKLDQ